MGLGGIHQFIDLRDWNLEIRGFDRATEPVELAHSGFRVIGDDLHATPFCRFGLYPVRVSEPATAPDLVECALKRFTPPSARMASMPSVSNYHSLDISATYPLGNSRGGSLAAFGVGSVSGCGGS